MVRVISIRHSTPAGFKLTKLFGIYDFSGSKGRDPFNQNFRKFRFETQWNGSAQLEKFRKMRSTFRGGPLFWSDRSDRKFAVPLDISTHFRFSSVLTSPRPKRRRREAFSPAKRMFPRFTRRLLELFLELSMTYFNVSAADDMFRTVLGRKVSPNCSCQVQLHVLYRQISRIS